MLEGAVPEAVVVITGPFEGVAVEQWERLIADALELKPQRLVVDLAHAPVVDAAAIVVLLEAHRAMIHSGGRLTLRRPVGRVRRILGLARVERVFDIEKRPAAVVYGPDGVLLRPSAIVTVAVHWRSRVA